MYRGYMNGQVYGRSTDSSPRIRWLIHGMLWGGKQFSFCRCTVKFHFVTIKHVVMFFKLQFSFQQLGFIFKIVKNTGFYFTILSCHLKILCLNPPNLQSADAVLSSPFPSGNSFQKNSPEDSVFIEIFLLVCLCNMHKYTFFKANIASPLKKLNKWIKFRSKAKQ